MRASVKPELHLLWAVFYCLFAWLLPALCDADPFAVEIENAEIILQDDSYVLSADINYQLSPRAMDALKNGVPLFWTVQVKVQQQRNYLWDRIIVNKKIRYRIQYHALLNMYRVRNENGGEVFNYSTLPAALDFMSTVRDFYLMDKTEIASGKDYLAKMKVKLDREALPLPLRPIAYANPQWYLSSAWYVWPLKK
ncbi:conserved hypothetical protein [Candidatus Methylobacter favarea]|uniref:DUF4390 domain-containing protein n=1 Tax=Candidatus Methylobacter favarea TaxID=2707345 RepID=A0A8S0X6I4_9GAMM|nr:DUF4390 domain-containing protein [Candidatus Methylobacter favarea]CAA9889285.1 conserved hypothetical protein [Candidatus Methylobacter favarea]